MSQELPTRRSQAKASRRRTMLDAAAALFAQRGFSRVSIEDLGAAAGVSGPAVYRHFSGKQALLGALLLDVSDELLSGGREVVATTGDDDGALRALISFHVDFALSNTDVIRVQDRDLDNLSPEDHKQVRILQRSYVELWVDLLGRLHPEEDSAARRIKAHAVFGLINSTPHSLQMHGKRVGAKSARPVLEQMAWAALVAPAA
ncbi:SACE_7040 family transcriptional regulator [Arthrobacter sp. 35W]|uniref:SACE_7040 family transcriptional regulator n=1 Tax=Arthrobacter sp. 35W TaxID=1132441 RepID=UPI0018CA2BEA|nr:TetR/AcrR family transcriptional regulator [Arthrobacter sp. 35W]